MWSCRSSVIQRVSGLRRSTQQRPWLLCSSSSYSDTPIKKPKLAPLQERKMIDRFRLWAKGGDGGNGCCSLRRSRHERRGKPDGGNGGRGGDVILECSSTIWDLRGLQHHTNAKRGGHGVSKNKIGSRGSDKVVLVPVGTVIHLVDGEIPSVVETHTSKALDPWDIPDEHEVDSSGSDQRTKTNIPNLNEMEREDRVCEPLHTSRSEFHTKSCSSSDLKSSNNEAELVSYSEKDDESENEDLKSDESISGTELDEDEVDEEEEEIEYNVAELTVPGQRVVVARGGEGGLGNASFGKVSKLSTPEMPDDEDQSSLSVGLPGSEAVLVLELKSIADIGLVGMPNAGKSTLLGAISKAKPTVGHYAFTTLRPSIGNLNYDDYFSVTVADIPGLIKGAHENRGLGHAFLRHIERTKVIAYVLDLAAALDGKKGIPPWEQLKDLVLELEYHQTGLSDRPSLVVANKIDEDGAEDVYEELKRRVQGVPIFPVCAVLEEGVTELKTGLRSLVNGGGFKKLELDGMTLN